MHRTAVASLFSLGLVGVTAAAGFSAQIAFVGPKDWSHVDMGAAATDTARTVEQWKLGGGGDAQIVTVIHDTTTTYDASVAAIKDNFSKNGIKPTVDKDTPCQGKTAHVVEYQIGPDGHAFITNRLVVPDGATGIYTVTYSRAQGYNFDDDVKSSEAAFCAATS